MTLDEAFLCFRSGVLSCGLPVPVESAEAGILGGRVSTLQHDGAGLRLVWDARSGLLVLEITHGPPDGPLFWLDLYKASGSGDQLVADQRDFDLDSAIEYGLDLMLPARGSGVE